MHEAIARRPFWRGVWRVADPKITLASASSLLVGAAAAGRDGALAWGWLLVTVIGIFCVEAAKNASGEIFDFDSGDDLAVADEDRSPFSGGKRVLVDGLMSRRQAALVALAFYALAAVAGLAIVAWREPRVLWLGVLGVGLAYFYHAPPLSLSYRGLGELAVGFCYGPLVAAGAYLVQRHALARTAILPSLPLGLLVAAFLVINEFPDARADAGAGKRTLVVRLGPGRAAWLYLAIVAVAYGAIGLLPLAGLPRAVWLGAMGLVPSLAAARRLLAAPATTARIVPAQGWTLVAFLLASVGMSAGLFVGAR